MAADVLLYIGGDAATVQGRRCHVTGLRCFSPRYGPQSRFTSDEARATTGLLDSGAFSDAPAKRVTPEQALLAQFAWEERATQRWGIPYQAEALVSYDLLIDEKWTGSRRRKQRWTVREADQAVQVTVEAAAYLASQRERLASRRLVLAVQGVDAQQYQECLEGILPHATDADWIGLGGWCIVGWHRSWLPTYWASMRRAIPRIASAGIARVHLFGVMYRPALGGLLWLCDQHGIRLSTDSSAPILSVTWGDKRKAGAVAATWEESVRIWRERLDSLRSSEYYREPPTPYGGRQLSLW